MLWYFAHRDTKGTRAIEEEKLCLEASWNQHTGRIKGGGCTAALAQDTSKRDRPGLWCFPLGPGFPSSPSVTCCISQFLVRSFQIQGSLPYSGLPRASLKATLLIRVDRQTAVPWHGHSVLSISVSRAAPAGSDGHSRSRLNLGTERAGSARWPVGNSAWCASLQNTCR